MYIQQEGVEVDPTSGANIMQLTLFPRVGHEDEQNDVFPRSYNKIVLNAKCNFFLFRINSRPPKKKKRRTHYFIFRCAFLYGIVILV